MKKTTTQIETSKTSTASTTTITAKVVNEVRNPSSMAGNEDTKTKVAFEKDVAKRPSSSPISDDLKAALPTYNPGAYSGNVKQDGACTVEVVNMQKSGEI